MDATLFVLDKGPNLIFPVKIDASYIKHKIQEEERIPKGIADCEIVNIIVYVNNQAPTTSRKYNSICDESSYSSPVLCTISSGTTNYSDELPLSPSHKVSTFIKKEYSKPHSSINSVSTICSSSDENGNSPDNDSRGTSNMRKLNCNYSTRKQKSRPTESSSRLENQREISYQNAPSSSKKRNRQSHEDQKSISIKHNVILSDYPVGPTDNDIICGKKSGKQKQQGNLYYREHINKNEKEYKSFSSKQKKEKREIVDKIYQTMKSSNCRFMEKRNVVWVEWSAKEAKTKIAQALREKRVATPQCKSPIKCNVENLQRENIDDCNDSFIEDIDAILHLQGQSGIFCPEENESLFSFESMEDLDTDLVEDDFDTSIYIDSEQAQSSMISTLNESSFVYTSFPQKDILSSPATQWYINTINYFFQEYFDAGKSKRNDIEDEIINRIENNSRCHNFVCVFVSKHKAISVTDNLGRKFLIRSSLLALQNSPPKNIWNTNNIDDKDEQDPRDSNSKDNNQGKDTKFDKNQHDDQKNNNNNSNNDDKRTYNSDSNGPGAKSEHYNQMHTVFDLFFNNHSDQYKDSRKSDNILPYHTGSNDIGGSKPPLQHQNAGRGHRGGKYHEKYQQLVQTMKDFVREKCVTLKASDLNIEGKKVDFRPSQLSSDTFSLMMTTKPLTAPWTFAFFIFVVQMTLIWLILGWQISTADVAFNATFTAAVKFSLMLTMITITRSTDLTVPISNLFSLWYKNHDEWSKVIPQNNIEDFDTFSNDLKLWALQIVLPNILKMLKGIFALEGMLLILVKNKSDALLDIAAISWIAELDNLLFTLANLGYLGFNLQSNTKSATKVIPREGRPLFVIGSFLIMLIIIGSHLKIIRALEIDDQSIVEDKLAAPYLEALSGLSPYVLEDHRCQSSSSL